MKLSNILIKKSLILSIFLITTTIISAQNNISGYSQDEINPSLITHKWKAQWISVPGYPGNAYGVYHFRKTLTLQKQPTSKFIINISADNRYKLYINGHFVSLGPAKGDVFNWNYTTIDIAPYLKAGKNIVAATVWNFADNRPISQMSFNQTGFIIQGNGRPEEIVNTDKTWLCCRDEAYSIWHKGKVLGYYAAGGTEDFDANKYPWGWKTLEYDDSDWANAKVNPRGNGTPKGKTLACFNPLLVPCPIPPMEMTPQHFAKVRQATTIQNGAEKELKVPSSFLSKNTTFSIPRNSETTIILDQGELTTAYPTLIFSGGKNTSISISYAESLYENIDKNRYKGDRNQVKGKIFVGYQDHITSDGEKNRSYTTLWWRTWRYIQLKIKTSNEPLVLNNIYSTFTAYPLKKAFTFEAKGHPELSKILKIGWHTARLCANETYMDCPYYEQLQYFGDTRLQALVTLYNTNDKYMVRNALEQGYQSMLSDGYTTSRYPSWITQFIPSYSLSWIDMGHDYWKYRKDTKFIKSLLPSFRNILGWYENQLKDNGSLDRIPFWFFADWAKHYPTGEPIRGKHGDSSYQDLVFLIALEEAADMEKELGIPELGRYYQNLATKLKKSIKDKYFDNKKGLFAENLDHSMFSQHVNSLAIIAGVVTGTQAKDVMLKTLMDKSLIQTTIYFSYYLNQALWISGLGDMYISNLDAWKKLMTYNVSTWPEQPIPSRSDCHGWGATPNIEFFRIVLGIDSDAPHFEKIVIAPHLGNLTEVSGTMPHPNGEISTSYKIKGDKLKAIINIPEGTSGRFVWQNKEYKLHSGEQEFTLPKK